MITKSCSTCSVPVEERPDTCVKSGCLSLIHVHDNVTHSWNVDYSGYQPIEREEFDMGKCGNCTEVKTCTIWRTGPEICKTGCDSFTQRTCGNCKEWVNAGSYRKDEYVLHTLGKCQINTCLFEHNRIAGMSSPCSWKPIPNTKIERILANIPKIVEGLVEKPKCEVCENVFDRRIIVLNENGTYKKTKSCPTCQPEKKKTNQPGKS